MPFFVLCLLLNFACLNRQDKQFGKVALFFPHKNPDATVESAIKHYKQYSLTRAYLGETFFWGLLPQPGDHLVFTFTMPVLIKQYVNLDFC
jgi:alpha-1,3-mannosylglycoprotein beta-1,4-N-acetylglucosaminyltransferase A/B